METKEDKINKLINVGFTKEQAEVLVDMIIMSGFSGGLF